MTENLNNPDKATMELSPTPFACELKDKFGFKFDLAVRLADYCESLLETGQHEIARIAAGISPRTLIDWVNNDKIRSVIGYYEQTLAHKAQDKLTELMTCAQSEQIQYSSAKFIAESFNPERFDSGIRRERERTRGDASLELFKQQISDAKETKKLESLDPFTVEVDVEE